MSAWIYKGCFERLFPDVEIAYLTADREFLGKEWLSYLLMDKPIPFRIRIRHSDRIAVGRGQPAIAGKRVFANLSVGETRILSGRRWVWGRPVYVLGTRFEPTQKADDDFLILITNFLDSLRFLSCT